jgi:hypothetical protein
MALFIKAIEKPNLCRIDDIFKKRKDVGGEEHRGGGGNGMDVAHAFFRGFF